MVNVAFRLTVMVVAVGSIWGLINNVFVSNKFVRIKLHEHIVLDAFGYQIVANSKKDNFFERFLTRKLAGVVNNHCQAVCTVSGDYGIFEFDRFVNVTKVKPHVKLLMRQCKMLSANVLTFYFPLHRCYCVKVHLTTSI